MNSKVTAAPPIPIGQGQRDLQLVAQGTSHAALYAVPDSVKMPELAYRFDPDSNI